MLNQKQRQNIVLIGMPWSGKSTTGVLLAKALAMPFVDTDVLIQAQDGRRLQEIIDSEGADALRRIEERYILQLECRGHVIATGGSVVYSDAAMQFLKREGRCYYLRLPLSTVQARATNIEFRGLVREPGQGLADLYAQREPLYCRYADILLECEGLDQEGVLRRLLEVIGQERGESRS